MFGDVITIYNTSRNSVASYTYGATNFAMRESVGVLENIFDKTLKFSTRFINALSISPEAIIMTGMFSLPTSIGQSIIEIIINYNHNGGIIGV